LKISFSVEDALSGLLFFRLAAAGAPLRYFQGQSGLDVDFTNQVHLSLDVDKQEITFSWD